MNIFKKLFGKKKEEEKKPECWYNNAHEEGEAARNSMPEGAAGSPNAHEAALTKSFVIHR